MMPVHSGSASFPGAERMFGVSSFVKHAGEVGLLAAHTFTPQHSGGRAGKQSSRTVRMETLSQTKSVVHLPSILKVGVRRDEESHAFCSQDR